MNKTNRAFTLIEIIVVVAIVGIITAVVLSALTPKAQAASCGGWFQPRCGAGQNELQQAASTQESLVRAVPVPQLTNSSERANVAKRAQLFDNDSKISYIYLVSYGKVMAFYSVTGKVSSLRSYMTPIEKLVDASGNTCSYDSSESFCYIVESADIDGTYGENVDGIFFFTTDGAYVEWKGEYMMSDQPLKLTTTPALVREIQ